MELDSPAGALGITHLYLRQEENDVSLEFGCDSIDLGSSYFEVCGNIYDATSSRLVNFLRIFPRVALGGATRGFVAEPL
jgi:hypothetical protein